MHGIMHAPEGLGLKLQALFASGIQQVPELLLLLCCASGHGTMHFRAGHQLPADLPDPQ